MAAKYKIFIPEDELDKFKGRGDEVFTETLLDEETHGAIEAKIIVSETPKEGYEELTIQARGGFLSGTWYVKILETEDEEEESVTVFQAARLGERRGYMLRSMMAEQKDDLKKETMTSELQKRLKRKQEIVKELLKEKDNE